MKQPRNIFPLSLFFSIIFLLVLISYNFYFSLLHPDPFTQAKKKMSSFSAGERYFGALSLWRLMAFSDSWDEAKKLESVIDPDDLKILQNQFNPRNLRQRLNQLAFIKIKSTDDWLEIARIYALLGNSSQSQAAIRRAYELDPIRSDVEKLFYSIGRISHTTSVNM